MLGILLHHLQIYSFLTEQMMMFMGKIFSQKTLLQKLLVQIIRWQRRLLRPVFRDEPELPSSRVPQHDSKPTVVTRPAYLEADQAVTRPDEGDDFDAFRYVRHVYIGGLGELVREQGQFSS